MASDHYMAVGVEQYIIDRDDEDCPEIGLHLAALKGDAVQLEELLTCHKDHVQVDTDQALRYRIWDLGLGSKTPCKGKIWAFWTKPGLFWDHFGTFSGLVVAIFTKTTAKLTQD